MKRREFFKYTAVTLTISPLSKLFPNSTKKKYANDIVSLGNT